MTEKQTTDSLLALLSNTNADGSCLGAYMLDIADRIPYAHSSHIKLIILMEHIRLDVPKEVQTSIWCEFRDELWEQGRCTCVELLQIRTNPGSPCAYFNFNLGPEEDRGMGDVNLAGFHAHPADRRFFVGDDHEWRWAMGTLEEALKSGELRGDFCPDHLVMEAAVWIKIRGRALFRAVLLHQREAAYQTRSCWGEFKRRSFSMSPSMRNMGLAALAVFALSADGAHGGMLSEPRSRMGRHWTKIRQTNAQPLRPRQRP